LGRPRLGLQSRVVVVIESTINTAQFIHTRGLLRYAQRFHGKNFLKKNLIKNLNKKNLKKKIKPRRRHRVHNEYSTYSQKVINKNINKNIMPVKK
jgi:hypothetical protein